MYRGTGTPVTPLFTPLFTPFGVRTHVRAPSMQSEGYGGAYLKSVLAILHLVIYNLNKL